MNKLEIAIEALKKYDTAYEFKDSFLKTPTESKWTHHTVWARDALMRIGDSNIELPTGKDILAAARKYRKSDHCQAAFVKGALWYKQQTDNEEKKLPSLSKESYVKHHLRQNGSK